MHNTKAKKPLILIRQEYNTQKNIQSLLLILIRQEQNSLWTFDSNSTRVQCKTNYLDVLIYIWQEHDVQQNNSKHKNISLGAIH
jgi:hypothetical protein